MSQLSRNLQQIAIHKNQYQNSTQLLSKLYIFFIGYREAEVGRLTETREPAIFDDEVEYNEFVEP